jgi:hypothetical protein
MRTGRICTGRGAGGPALRSCRVLYRRNRGQGSAQGDVFSAEVDARQRAWDAAGRRAKTRQWRIRQTAPDHYVGTLTDASGPVRLDVTGNCLRIHYHAKGGLAFSQVLTLQPGGQISQNVMKVRKLGMVVATIRETITRR